MEFQFDESEVDEPEMVFVVVGMMFASVGAALYTVMASEMIGFVISLLAVAFVLVGLYYLIG